MWPKAVIQDHREAAKRLTDIALGAFAYLGEHPRATEGEVKDLVLAEFRRRGLVMDKPFQTPIVGFGSNAADPHYCPVPGARRLKPGTLVMIDVWGRLKGKHKPYADITWMGYYGNKVPQLEQKVFDAVLASRDACMQFVRQKVRRGALPTGQEADEAANKVIRDRGYGKFIRHSTGHILGFASPHGRGRYIGRKNIHALEKGFGYTIEPGIYMKGKLGVRSEMNFYVDASGEFLVTTPLQRKLVRIGK